MSKRRGKKTVNEETLLSTDAAKAEKVSEQAEIAEQTEALEQAETVEQVKNVEQAETTEQIEVPEQVIESERIEGSEQIEVSEPAEAMEPVESAENNTKKVKKKSTVKKVTLISLSAVVFLLVATYIGFSIYFTNHYFYRTIIAGVDYSCKKPEEVEQAIIAVTGQYRMEIFGRDDLYDTINAEEISLQYVFDGSLQRILESQKGYLWIEGLLEDSCYEIPKAVEYDRSALQSKVKSLVFFQEKNVREPADAFISEYSETERAYLLIQEDYGASLLMRETLDVVGLAIEELNESLNLDTMGCYKVPGITTEDKALQALYQKLNTCVGTIVTYDYGDSTEVVDGELIKDWIIMENGAVTIDAELVREHINALSKEHDTYGCDRTFRTTDGRELVLKSGAFGWRTDREGETEALIADIEAGEVITKQPLYLSEGAVPGKADIGNTYVEIDLSAQHLYVYEEGELTLESDFVSGNMSRGWGTPAGVFGLSYKTKNAVLRGENYETPVNYWMPFNGNVGMHDATWRRTFGGDIYMTGGSHGCINLPLSNAKKIYEIVYKGMPVICYY